MGIASPGAMNTGSNYIPAEEFCAYRDFAAAGPSLFCLFGEYGPGPISDLFRLPAQGRLRRHAPCSAGSIGVNVELIPTKVPIPVTSDDHAVLKFYSSTSDSGLFMVRRTAHLWYAFF